jgi:hypothetical protein
VNCIQVGVKKKRAARKMNTKAGPNKKLKAIKLDSKRGSKKEARHAVR